MSESSSAKTSTDDEQLLSKVADALRKAEVAMARKDVEEQVLPLERLKSAFLVAQVEADRSASILLFALAEDIMLEAFKCHLNPSIRGGWSGVTGGNGVLATASDRIALLELLYWIRPRSCADLRLMKSIRNRFAHHAEVNSFGDTKVAGWVTSMTSYEDPALTLIRKQIGQADRTLSLRERFLMRSLGTLVNLATDLAVGPIATKRRVSPSDLTGGGFDSQPDNIKEATLFQAGMYIDLMKGIEPSEKRS